jgi:hypothetical protein
MPGWIAEIGEAHLFSILSRLINLKNKMMSFMQITGQEQWVCETVDTISRMETSRLNFLGCVGLRTRQPGSLGYVRSGQLALMQVRHVGCGKDRCSLHVTSCT